MNRFLLISVGTLSCILLGVLLGGSSVNAASVYDNFFDERVVEELVLTAGTCTVNVSDNWSQFDTFGSTYNFNGIQEFKDNLYNKFHSNVTNGGSWAVVQTSNSSYTVRWTENTTSKATINENGYVIDPWSRSSSFRIHSVILDPVDCQLKLIWQNSNFYDSPNTNIILYPGTNTNKLFLSTYEFTAPVGYEGITPPDSHTEECLRECRIVIAPNFEYDYDDKQISVTDLENDLLPEFEPDEGYTSLGYEIEWSLWKCTVEYDNGLCKNGENELVELKHTPLLEGNTWNNLDYGYYRVEAQYVVQQCYRYPSYPATPDYCFYVDLGTEFGKVYLFEKRSRSINLDGTSGSGNTSDENCDVSGECTSGTVGGLLPCFGPDPPYVQVDGCIKNIFWVVDSLSFSKITIMEIKSNTMQCKQLDTIGGWINRPGITVCPMFPSHVRDVVTPFITLAIGLFLGSFIMRLASRGVR